MLKMLKNQKKTWESIGSLLKVKHFKKNLLTSANMQSNHSLSVNARREKSVLQNKIKKRS